MTRSRVALVGGVCLVLNALLLAPGAASAAIIGSNLAIAANDSVCKFQAFEPKTRVCAVDQVELLTSHRAGDGLVAPFDGIIVRWSVVSGLALPGTGSVRLALRARNIYLEKGPEVELPLGAPGSRYTFPERLPIAAGQPVALKIAVTNSSTQEAGAPIAHAEIGVGRAAVWAGEPWESAVTDEEETELLFNAEIEPDADKDGYGDLTQDCFPNHPGDQELCGRDIVPPAIQPRFAARQAFLRSGAILVRVTSNEAGLARAKGQLEIKGRDGRTYELRGGHKPITAGGSAALRLRLGKKALKSARAAVRDGKKILASVQVGVVDGARNAREATVRIRPTRTR